jgi:phage/plasmid-like protein (TIGR03299 family)
MSHEIETIAYTNEVPWHGLGTYIQDAPSVDDMLIKAGLDWTVVKAPVHAEHDTGLVSTNEHFALVRSTDGKILDVCGKHYIPVQNRDALGFFRSFVEAGDATLETAGSLKGGRNIWGLANLGQNFHLKNNTSDQLKSYLLISSPHEVGKSLQIKFTSVRVVCNNTLTLALNSAAQFRMSHRLQFDEFNQERAREVLGIARDESKQFEQTANLLSTQKLSHDDIIRVLQPVYQPDHNPVDLINSADKYLSPTIKAIMYANENAPGADPATAWGLLNAVTYYSDHVASRSVDKRMYNAWFGKTANHKEKILNTLVSMAA